MSHENTQNTRTEKLWTDFLQAVHNGDENKWTRILIESVSPVRERPNPFLTGQIPTTQGTLTALHLAVKHGKESIANLLLEKGIDINAVSHPNKYTALHMAVEQLDDNIGIIQILLGHKDVNVNKTDAYGHTPIKIAAEKGNAEAVKLLLDKGADITIADKVDSTAIHVAADKGQYEVLQLLLPKAAAENPGIIGSQNKEQNTPLHLAVRKQCVTTVAVLICYGAIASLGVKNQHNETPKELAAGNKRIIKLLESPSKASQPLRQTKLSRPGTKVIGRGGSVEADSDHHPFVEPQVPISSHIIGLPGVAGVFQPTVINVSTPQFTIHNEFKTEVRDGGSAAIGPGSEVHVGGSTVTSGPRSQPPPAAESSFHVNISGGNASIGDHSVTNVGTATPSASPQPTPAAESSYNINVSGGNASIGDHNVTNVDTATPRTPSTAGTIKDPEQPQNKDSRNSDYPKENASVGTLSCSVPDGTSSENPTESENSSDTTGKLPNVAPEVGSTGSPAEQGNVTDTPGALSYPCPSGVRVVNLALLQKRIREARMDPSKGLDFSHMGLPSFPMDLPDLSYSVNRRFLTKLNLSHNRLTELPEHIGDLVNLTHLFVNDNLLVLLPTTIKQLQHLRELDLRNNKLKSLFKEIADLIHLEKLCAEGNPVTIEDVRSLTKLMDKRPGLVIDITTVVAPLEIQAQGQGAELLYKKAIRDGYVNVYRGRILLIDQDRAGKTSLKKSLLHQPFDPNEQSTQGIEIDPSNFEIAVDRFESWHCNRENKTMLSEVSREISRVLAEERYVSILSEVSEDSTLESEGVLSREESKEKGIVLSDDGFHINQVAKDADGSKERDISLPEKNLQLSTAQNKGANCLADGDGTNTIKEPELLIDATSLPDDVTEHANEYLRHMFLRGHQAVGDANRQDSIVNVDLWDFAGQHLYYASHPVFLSPRAVYILVHNHSKPLDAPAEPLVRQGTHDVRLENPNSETNLENLLSWLVTVHRIKPTVEEMVDNTKRRLPYLRPPVIIVGTHADKPFEDTKKMTSQIQQRISGKEYEKHVIRPLFSVDNTQSNQSLLGLIKSFLWQDPQRRQYTEGDTDSTSVDGIDALRDKIMEVLRQEPYMGEKIPLRWLNFEKVIEAFVAQNIHYKNVEQLQTVAKEVCFIQDEDEFYTMLNFYHDLGLIIRHRNTVVLKAEWLIDLFRQLITIPRFDEAEPLHSKYWQELERSGVLRMELVDHVFSEFIQQSVVKEDILDMMEQFGLIAKFTSTATDTKYFVPAQLKTSPKDVWKQEPSSSDPCPLYLLFADGFVPHGLFTQLMSRSISWCCETWQRTPLPKLYQNGAWLVINARQFVYDFILLSKKSFVKIILKRRNQGKSVSVPESVEVASRVRVFIQDTLQRLSHELPCLNGLQYQLCIACPCCVAECTNHRQVSCTHEECLHLVELKEGKQLICMKNFSGREIPVRGMELWLSLRRSQGLYPSTLVAGTTEEAAIQGGPGNSAKALNVALLASEWGSSMGGLSTINRNLAILFAKHSQVHVTLLVPQFACCEEDKRDAASCNITIQEVQRRPGFDDPLDWLSFPPKDLAIDIVLGHGAKLGKQAQVIKESHSCKWVQVVHTAPEELGMHKNYSGAIAKGEDKNRAEVDLCKLSDLVVAVGPKLAGAYSSYLRCCKKHQDIIQLTPGTFREFTTIEQAAREGEKFKVLTFGRGDSEDFSLKGYDIAAKAVVELNDSSYCLVFVGAPSGKQEEVARNLLQTGISEDQLIVRAFLQSKERLKDLFCEVDLAIMPSRTEGFGLTALEALSAGLPILVGGNSGFAYALRDLPSGKSFVVESKDPKEWAKAIASARQKERAQRLQEIQTLRTNYEEKYSWKDQCGALVEKMWIMAHETSGAY